MTKKRKKKRYTKKDGAIWPTGNLVVDIIIDACNIASGQSAATDLQRSHEALWLRSETCRRWAGAVGVDIRVALEHKDSLVKLEEIE